jgi:hypothetical protein
VSAVLNYIIEQYIKDKRHQDLWSKRIKYREEKYPQLKRHLIQFVEGPMSLSGLSIGLKSYLSKENYDSSRQKNSREWLLAELTVLIEYHGEPAEIGLRQALSGLDRNTVGSKIEFFHDFLQREHDRISETMQFVPDLEKSVKKKHIGRPMAPLNAALMITLFASVLDRGVYFCDVYVRRALSLFERLDIITIKQDVHYDTRTMNIEVRSERDFLFIKNILDTLVANNPRININHAWAEIFTRWIIDNEAMIVSEAARRR